MEHHHEHSQKIIHRLSRAIGHLEAIRNIGREIPKDHIAHCVADAARSRDEQVIDDLNAALDRFMK